MCMVLICICVCACALLNISLRAQGWCAPSPDPMIFKSGGEEFGPGVANLDSHGLSLRRGSEHKPPEVRLRRVRAPLLLALAVHGSHQVSLPVQNRRRPLGAGKDSVCVCMFVCVRVRACVCVGV